MSESYEIDIKYRHPIRVTVVAPMSLRALAEDLRDAAINTSRAADEEYRRANGAKPKPIISRPPSPNRPYTQPPTISTLGKFETEPSKQTRHDELHPDEPLMNLVMDKIALTPTAGERINAAKAADALETLQRESTLLLSSITRGEQVWRHVHCENQPFGTLFTHLGATAAHEAQWARIYLAARAGMLEGCTTKHKAEIRLGIRTPGGELKREWM